MKYTIAISTHVHRFEEYFKPLVLQIKKNLPEVELMIYVNGQLNGFNETYRKNMLNFLAQYDNTYPIMSPYFRGCSKMWNSLIVQSTHNKIFILNDDIYLQDQFFTQIPQLFKLTNTSFRLNGSFSHFCVDRNEVFDVGFFDERLIAIGEEDGDWCFRWEKFYQKHLPSLYTPYIIRYNGYTSNLKETPWNSDWIFKNKYDVGNNTLAISQGFPANGQGGMFGKPVALREDYIELDLYPAEKFYWEHISEVNENLGIKN
jgi:GR25 family glycosyltransferase involved in LPS biosynthesis